MTATTLPRVNHHTKHIVLAHGGGGQLMDELLSEIIRPRLSNPDLDTFDDSAVLEVPAGKVVFTTDSFVVAPLEFPGGDIGRLAISGTINDLAVCGAIPQWVSLGLIIEEGFPIETLCRLLDSIAAAAREAGVTVVTGDTKVVAKGQADGIYINTAALGLLRPDLNLSLNNIQPGDAVLVSGTIADHGMAVMLQREDSASIQSTLTSDCAPLGSLVDALIGAAPDIRFMRDPTRGGVAGVLSDLAEFSGFRTTINEPDIPLRPATGYAAEMLGIDPLDVANEGKLIAVVPDAQADDAINAMRAHPLGRSAAVIGRIENTRDALCEIITDVGGRRIIQKPYGEQLPRIC